MTSETHAVVAPEIAHHLNELTFLVAFLCKDQEANLFQRAQLDMSRLAMDQLGHSIIADSSQRQVNAMLTKCFISVLHDCLA